MSVHDSVDTGGALLGEDTTNSEASPLEIFKDKRNHVTALTTLLRFVQEQSGYDPDHNTGTENSDKFNYFLSEVKKIPYLNIMSHDFSNNEIMGESNSNQLTRGVVSLFKKAGVPQELNEVMKISESITDMCNAFFQATKSKEIRHHSGRFAIHVDDGIIKLIIYNAKFEVKLTSNWFFWENVCQTSNLNINVFQLDSASLSYDAEDLSKLRKETAQSWIKRISQKQKYTSGNYSDEDNDDEDFSGLIYDQFGYLFNGQDYTNRYYKAITDNLLIFALFLFALYAGSLLKQYFSNCN